MQRLDVHNGLLLSALWDAAFDQGLVSFADEASRALVPSSARLRERLLASTQRHRFVAFRMRIAPIYHCINAPRLLIQTMDLNCLGAGSSSPAN